MESSNFITRSLSYCNHIIVDTSKATTPASTITGANGVFPAYCVPCCGSKRVQNAIHNTPSNPIASHQMTIACKPHKPTAKPISNVVVTSPNPKAPGFIKANATCTAAHSNANSSDCNTTNKLFVNNAYMHVAINCAATPTAIQRRGTRRQRMSLTETASPQIRLGMHARYHITLK